MGYWQEARVTKEEISQVYQTLETLEIKLEQTPELGTEYLTDRLLECRQKQNTVTDLIVKANRAYSASRQAVRAQEAICRMAGMSERAKEHRDDLAKMLDERDALKYLLEALAVRRANLGRTSSDIRLMAGIIDAERRPGNANAGPQRPTPAPQMPPPEPRLGPQSPPTMADFEEGINAIKAKLASESPAAEVDDLLVATPASPVSEMKGPGPELPVTPPPASSDDEVDIEAFLESS